MTEQLTAIPSSDMGPTHPFFEKVLQLNEGTEIRVNALAHLNTTRSPRQFTEVPASVRFYRHTTDSTVKFKMDVYGKMSKYTLSKLEKYTTDITLGDKHTTICGTFADKFYGIATLLKLSLQVPGQIKKLGE